MTANTAHSKQNAYLPWKIVLYWIWTSTSFHWTIRCQVHTRVVSKCLTLIQWHNFHQLISIIVNETVCNTIPHISCVRLCMWVLLVPMHLYWTILMLVVKNMQSISKLGVICFICLLCSPNCNFNYPSIWSK